MRPLSDKGLHQADAITSWFAGRAVDRTLSSSSVRCVQTLEPLARDRGLDIEAHDALYEGASVAATTALIWDLASHGTDAVLSSHGDVIPNALDGLAGDGVDVEVGHGLPKGTLYVLDVDGDGAITTARFVDPRR